MGKMSEGSGNQGDRVSFNSNNIDNLLNSNQQQQRANRNSTNIGGNRQDGNMSDIDMQ